MKSRRKTFFLLFLTVLLCAGAVWYWKSSAAGQSEMNYLTESVRRGEILATVNASGELDAVVSVDVGAQVSGQIEKTLCGTWSAGQKGDLIADIDSTTQRNELEKEQGAACVL